MTLFGTAVQTAIIDVQKWIRPDVENENCLSGPFNIVVLADGLFGLCGSERE